MMGILIKFYTVTGKIKLAFDFFTAIISALCYFVYTSCGCCFITLVILVVVAAVASYS